MNSKKKTQSKMSPKHAMIFGGIIFIWIIVIIIALFIFKKNKDDKVDNPFREEIIVTHIKEELTFFANN